MSNATHNDHGSPATETVQYLMTAPPADWAWEFLRRLPEYQNEAETATIPELVASLPNAGSIFRTKDNVARAGRWGLCSFRSC